MEIRTVSSFLDYYEKIRKRTHRVIASIPPDRIEWAYREDKFTFGDLIRHLGATERYMFAENARNNPSRYAGHGKELAEGYDAVMVFFHRTHEESMKIFSNLTDQDLQERCTTPGGISITVWKWLRAMIEHEVHHRGQLYIYLGILGVKAPPLYGMTSEQVSEKSVR